jgi:AmmeMemoRadiSam system protein B
MLDNGLFLVSPRFSEAERRVREDFLKSPTRPPALAGLSYARSAAALNGELDRYLEHAKDAKLSTAPSGSMAGLVAPHIDYRRGQVSYGITYKRLSEPRHDLYVLIGTSHQFSRGLFHLTSKDFETPIGPLPCDREFIGKLADGYGTVRAFSDELLHRREHSLELQTPFIRRLHGEARIAPILVGSFHHMLGSGKLPHEYDEYEAFTATFASLIKKRRANGQRVCVIAGVDMAHIGKHFGDKEALTAEKMAHIAERDRQYLDAILAHDKLRLFSHIEEDGDARRICGFPTMYTVLDAFERAGMRYRGELFDYRQAVDYAADCAVTFAGVGMYVS